MSADRFGHLEAQGTSVLSGNRSIAECIYDPRRRETIAPAQALAQLFAAAPDLLEALQWLVNASDKPGIDPEAVLLIASERARDAIVKAEGKS